MADAAHFANGTHARFEDTHWSVVLAAQGEGSSQALAALEILCRSYWYPIYAYVRRCGEGPAEAQDFTQEFFARFLERGSLRVAHPDRGRFRWLLLASLKHFLANEWDRARAQKRGGGHRPVSFDALDPEARYALEPVDGMTADKIYDRSWAMQLLEQVRQRLHEEFSTAGRAERFEMLEQFLPGEQSAMTYAEAALRLGVAEGTIKSDVSRLRRRYGEVLRAEVASTVGSHTDLEGELRHLIEALS